MYNMKSKKNNIATNTNVADAETCQKKFCQKTVGCKYFAYNQKTKICNLKTEKAFDVIESTQQNITFGPRVCTGVFRNIVIYIK